jgi:hypothetical protein
MDSKKKINQKAIAMKSKDFINPNNYPRKTHIQTEVKKIIQKVMKKVLRRKTVHTKRVYMSKNKH